MTEGNNDYGYWTMLKLNPLGQPNDEKMTAFKAMRPLQKLFKSRAIAVCDKIVSQLHSLKTKKDKIATTKIYLRELRACDWVLATKANPEDPEKYRDDNLVFVVICPEKDRALLEGPYRGNPQNGDTGIGIILPISGKGNQPFIPSKKGKALFTFHSPLPILKRKAGRLCFA